MSETSGAAPTVEVRSELEKAVAAFNERARTEAKFQETLQGMDRLIQLDVDGDATYHFHLKDNHIDGVQAGPAQNAQVVVTTDKETLLGIFAGTVSPMSAYVRKKIKFKATLMDLLVLKKLF